MSMETTTFGARLKAAIQHCGMSQNQFAAEIDSYAANVSHFVNDHVTPTQPTLAKILAALPTIDARWLITGESP